MRNLPRNELDSGQSRTKRADTVGLSALARQPVESPVTLADVNTVIADVVKWVNRLFGMVTEPLICLFTPVTQFLVNSIHVFLLWWCAVYQPSITIIAHYQLSVNRQFKESTMKDNA